MSTVAVHQDLKALSSYWESKSNWFALLCCMIGLKKSRHFFIQSEVKSKPIAKRWRTFSRPLSQLHAFTSSPDWLIGLSVHPLWLARDITLLLVSRHDWKPLYSHGRIHRKPTLKLKQRHGCITTHRKNAMNQREREVTRVTRAKRKKTSLTICKLQLILVSHKMARIFEMQTIHRLFKCITFTVKM